MDDKMADIDFRTWLKLELDRLHLSQAELARMSGVPQPTIQRILSGETGDPRGSTMAKLRRVLGGKPNTEPLTTDTGISNVVPQTPMSRIEINHKTRRETFARIREQFKTLTALAKALGEEFSPSYVSQLLNGHSGMGDSTADKIELRLRLPFGYLDRREDDRDIALVGAKHSAASNDDAELLQAWALLVPAEKEAIMEQIRPMAAHNKAVLDHHAKMVTKA